jgi:hypothetical protein
MKLLSSTTSEPFFQFQNQAIATIYDPPWLLKWTRDLFLKYDVQFESERLDSQLLVAKWENIEKYTNTTETLWSVCCISWLTPSWSLLLSVPWKWAWRLKSWATE